MSVEEPHAKNELSHLGNKWHWSMARDASPSNELCFPHLFTQTLWYQLFVFIKRSAATDAVMVHLADVISQR